MKWAYRTKTTSPLPQVHDIFEVAIRKNIGATELSELTGYSVDAIAELRCPRMGRGKNPSFALVRDVAQSLGCEIRVVPRGWRGQEETGD